MSLENEDQSSEHKDPGSFLESKKQSKISYAREFLLSLSELDICKKLPQGFDRSILSEFDVASHGTQDRQRTTGPLQGFRRNDFGSSPPIRGESGNYSRGIYGRRDSRSGRSDRDSDSQSDRDSDSGRHHGSQSHRSWQSSEHDGLLGSGSFPRPSGYAAGTSAAKFRANDHYQLNRSTELYHPPRPYKAVPHLRRDANDSYNDETFGSTECTSQDRAEEEKWRRDSFELMRKEQQKAFQEKQNMNEDRHKEGSFLDVSSLSEEKEEESRPVDKNNGLDVSAIIPISGNDSVKSSFPSLVPAARPLVPPGFMSSPIERSSTSNSDIHTHQTEVGNPGMEESLLHGKVNSLQNGTLVDQDVQSTHRKMLSKQHPEDKSIPALSPRKVERTVNSLLDVSDKIPVMDSHLYRASNLSEARETLDHSEIIELNSKKATGHNILSDSNQDNSTSILEKLFTSALAVDIDSGSGFTEHHGSKQDDTQNPSSVLSSKFAHWFLEEDKKPADVSSSCRSSNLLSLIVGGDKGGVQVSGVKAIEHVRPELSNSNFGPGNGLPTSNLPAATIGISEQSCSGPRQAAVPVILKCEDLEHTILSEYSEKGSILKPPEPEWSASVAKIEQHEEVVDNRASEHLLSLLQKGTDLVSTVMDSESLEKFHVSVVGDISTATPEKSTETDTTNIQNSQKTLILEALFGTAFMKELQSVDAPVSVQNGSVGSARTDVSEPRGLSFPIMEDELLSNRVNETGSSRTSQESNILTSNHSRQIELNKIDNWLGFEDSKSSNLQTEATSKHDGFNRAVEIQLPEEESLITLGDPVNPSNSMFMPAGNSSNGEFLSSNLPLNMVEKYSALNTVFKDENPGVGQESQPFVRGSYERIEPEVMFNNLHTQTSSPQIHPSQNSRGWPFFHSMDSHPSTHMNSQMKFLAPHNIIHHDGSPNHQLPGNMLRVPLHQANPNPGLDRPSHQSMLQKMQMPGNFPPPLHEFHRGVPLPPYCSNQMTTFMQEPNPMQGSPFSHRQPNIGSLGMPLPAPDVNGGGNHPQAFQRLIEMELRANAKKQNYPFGNAQSQGVYGHRLDMGFRYR